MKNRVTKFTLIRTSNGVLSRLGLWAEDWRLNKRELANIRAQLRRDGHACGGDIERIELAE